MPETREITRELDRERSLADGQTRLDDGRTRFEDEPGLEAERRRLEDEEEDRGDRLDFQTLALAALASAAAALVTSRLWSQGAIVSAAMTPVIVALVKEGLRKPTERVTAVGSRVASASRGSLALTTPRPDARTAPERAPRRDAFAGRRVLRSKRFHLRMALITGLLAFLIAVFALTVPELIVGDSVGSGGGTTLFGGDGGDDAGSSEDPASEGTSAPSGPGEAPAPAPDQQPESQPQEAPSPEEEAPAEEAPSQPVAPQAAPPSGTGD